MAEAPQLPIGGKHYIACRKCHSILTEPQYLQDGCFKCGERGDRGGLGEFTTTKFSGFMGIVDSEHSWVARVIGCANMPSGVYAANINDEDLEEDEEDAYEDEGEDTGNAYHDEEHEQRVEVATGKDQENDSNRKRSREGDMTAATLDELLAM